METKNYPMVASSYKLLEKIGAGSSNNEVWRAEIIEGPHQGDQVGIKILDLEEFKQENMESIRKEVQILNLCKHNNIVPYYCSFVEKTKLWLVMKILAGSCLDILRYKYPNGIEDEYLIACILKGALQGLAYLHEHSQLHRDVKAANILLSPDGVVQLADFGVSAALESHDQRRTTFVGTVCYMAPEVLDPSETGGYDSKADIWSLGITAIELAYGKPPYALNQPMKVIMLLMKHPPPSLDVPEYQSKSLSKNNRKFSQNFKDFVDKCLQKDPKKRPSSSTLLSHPFLKQIKEDTAAHTYIQENMLSEMPSVGDRYRSHIEKIKNISKAKSRDKSKIKTNEEEIEWDFGEKPVKSDKKSSK